VSTGLLYQDLIRSGQLTASGQLPPVLPLVLYNGVRRWQAPEEVAELVATVPGCLERYRPSSAARPAHARLDDEPFRYFDFAEVNARYRAILDMEPVPVAEFARLHDPAIIRHTVAYHGSVIRQIDVPRFQYYSVTPGALINPPPAFVRETSNYLYQIDTGFELAVRNHVLTRVIAPLAPDWSKPPPQLLVDLIEAFDYFGILFSEDDLSPEHRAVPMNDKEDAEQQRVATEIMLARCLAQLQPK
jgi:hypothetical protein